MRRNSVTIILRVFMVLSLAAASTLVRAQSQMLEQKKPIALVGGTLIDVTNFGNSKADLRNAVVIVSGDKIVAVGLKRKMKIPADARVVDVTGKYIVPGLTDGFAGLKNQAHANAYLYMGVTSIVGAFDPGTLRGPWFKEANPSPRVFFSQGGLRWGVRKDDGSYEIRPDAEIIKRVEELKAEGARRVFIFHPVPPSVTKLVAPLAHKLGMGTLAEISVTTYPEAIEAGVQSFVHSNRYSRELAPPEMQAEYIKLQIQPPGFREFIAKLDPNDERVRRWAKRLAESKVALMPTLSLFYNFLPVHDNPWKEPIASIIDPKTIHLPLDPITGNHNHDEVRRIYNNFNYVGTYEANIFRIEEQYRKAGVRYLVGSGTSAVGTLPGISTHTEMKLLVSIGLTPRQAIAAATNNFAEVYGWKEMGQVAAGRVADIVVVDENPTQDIANLKKIHMVMLRGEILDREKFLRK